jgi:CRP-like cAMP-binding protein/formate hydrogenlyase subunit 6/NADH:ubiquinone oxidoreductase subunit I
MSPESGAEAPNPVQDDPAEWAWSEEGLFVRDVDGRLIRYDAATREELDRDITLEIDGRTVVVKKAVVATDEQGRPRYDAGGEVIPRPTTIYDAVTRRYEQADGHGAAPGPSGDGPSAAGSFKRAAGESSNPIPILCHTLYMDPVAVCRVCVVQLARFRRRTGKIEVDDKLLPACQHRVEDGMIVDTIASPDPAARARIEGSVKTLLGLLMSDHPTPCAKEQQHPGDCELEALARRFGVTVGRFPGRAELPRDDSSLVIAVDHNACILCDRCVRGCDVIKENHVIGRMGKGYTARIVFDLDTPMGSSTCVACGECSDDCPTGALTHRRVIATQLPSGEDVAVDALIGHEIPQIRQAFQGVSRPFLRSNTHAVKRRTYRKGEVICREGEYGSSAFFIERGSVNIFIRTPIDHIENQPQRGFWGALGRFTTRLTARAADRGRDYIPIDAPVALPYGRPQATMAAGDIFGEMTCMSYYPRSATVTAAEDCTVLEMLRNVLYIMQRSPSFRRDLEAKYRARAIDNHLRSLPLFASLRGDEAQFARIVDELRPRVSLRRCEPGEVIFRQGAPAVDGLYLVRTGFVKVSQSRPGGERVLNYTGPGGYIGEIGVLSDLPELRDLAPAGVRTATCTALDHVDLVRITPADFRTILDRSPDLRASVVAEARARLEANLRDQRDVRETPLASFLDQGLQEAQSLLVLDLVKCTRCDECTKACADTHQGVTRLIREGLRFDRFLVASSCRSCLDPYCMVGCPVGSIRRRESSEIHIEDWCIGCGLCAENCPYGNINMVEQYDKSRKADVRKATTCDLCTSLGPNHEPSCVYACPHDAAHRMKGTELLELVRRQEGRVSEGP